MKKCQSRISNKCTKKATCWYRGKDVCSNCFKILVYNAKLLPKDKDERNK